MDRPLASGIETNQDQPPDTSMRGANVIGENDVLGEHDWLDPVGSALRTVAGWLSVTGAAGIAAGALVLLDPNLTLPGFALIIGAYLLTVGLSMLLFTFRGREDVHRWQSRVTLGLLTSAAGVVVLGLPGTTVAVMATAVGVIFIGFGLGELLISAVVRPILPGARILIFAGLANIVAGGLAVAWPEVTMRVLTLVFGFHLLLIGMVAVGLVVQLRRALDRWAEGSPTTRLIQRTEIIDLRDRPVPEYIKRLEREATN